jgi:hypothetical protein
MQLPEKRKGKPKEEILAVLTVSKGCSLRRSRARWKVVTYS